MFKHIAIIVAAMFVKRRIAGEEKGVGVPAGYKGDIQPSPFCGIRAKNAEYRTDEGQGLFSHFPFPLSQ